MIHIKFAYIPGPVALLSMPEGTTAQEVLTHCTLRAISYNMPQLLDPVITRKLMLFVNGHQATDNEALHDGDRVYATRQWRY